MSMQDIVSSSTYYHTRLDENIRNILNSYRQEIDYDDWEEAKLPLSYQVINYALKQSHSKQKDLGYQPELIEQRVLSQEDMRIQVDNARIAKMALESFPRLTTQLSVYRGFMCGDFYHINSMGLRLGEEFTIPYFLSTTLDRNIAAGRFSGGTGKCLWKINMYPGTPLAFLGEDPYRCNECEVLLNIGAILRLVNKVSITADGYSLLEFDLIGYSKHVETRQFWPTVFKVASQYAK